jgi:hypothetical protein
MFGRVLFLDSPSSYRRRYIEEADFCFDSALLRPIPTEGVDCCRQSVIDRRAVVDSLKQLRVKARHVTPIVEVRVGGRVKST